MKLKNLIKEIIRNLLRMGVVFLMYRITIFFEDNSKWLYPNYYFIGDILYGLFGILTASYFVLFTTLAVEEIFKIKILNNERFNRK